MVFEFVILLISKKKESVKLREQIEVLKAEKSKPAPAKEATAADSQSPQREAARANAEVVPAASADLHIAADIWRPFGCLGYSAASA